jgi:hypothetical protein
VVAVATPLRRRATEVLGRGGIVNLGDDLSVGSGSAEGRLMELTLEVVAGACACWQAKRRGTSKFANGRFVRLSRL